MDMRDVLQEGQTVYLEAGETFDAHFSGIAGTGYSWINNHQFETNEERNVEFLDSYSVKDNDVASNWADIDEVAGLRPGRHLAGGEVNIF